MIPFDTPSRQAIGLTSGKYPPYAVLVDSKAKDADAWHDDTSGTHGWLYPTNLATAEQTMVNANVTAIKSYCPQDDNSYTASATKKKILGNYFNNYKNVSRVGLFVDELYASPQTINGTAANNDRDVCEIDTDKVAFVYLSSGGIDLKVRIATLSSLGTWTLGTETQLDASANCNSPRITKLSAGVFVVGYYDSNTVKARVVTVSGTTPTIGASANATTNSNKFNGICKLDTTKFAMTFIDNTSSDIEGIAATISGTTITFGTKATIFTGTSAVTSGNMDKGRYSTVQVATDKFFTIWAENNTQPYYNCITVSGTTLTVGTEGQLTDADFNYNQTLQAIQVTTDKILVLGGTSTATNGILISYSGTTATVGSATTIMTAASSYSSRTLILQSSSKVLVVSHATIGGVTGAYANELQIAGTIIIKGDTHLVASGSTSRYDFIQTTNYTVAITASSGLSAVAVAHSTVTITVKSGAATAATFATSQPVKLLTYFGGPSNVTGRKVYMTVQNNNAFTQNIVFGNVYANVE